MKPVKDQAAEISRLKGVIAKCRETLQLINTSHHWESITCAQCQNALAAIKEEEL